MGLGAGSLATYAQPRQRWTLFEIDPAVVQVARDPRWFRYLSDCQALALNVVVDDARIALARDADTRYDCISIAGPLDAG